MISVDESADQVTLIITKEYFVVKLSFNLYNDVGVKAIKQSTVTLGASKTAAICEASKDIFVVFSSEGAPAYFNATDEDLFLQPYLFKNHSTFDFKNQVCNLRQTYELNTMKAKTFISE